MQVSSYKAIAACTQTLVSVVHNAIREVPGAHVTQRRPEDQAASAQNEPRVNLYLVQTRPDPTMRSSDLPMRDDNDHLISIPRVTLNLRYMLTFFGPPPTPHLMLGAAELAMRVNAVFSPDLVRRALAHSDELKDSGLDRQLPPVQLVPATVTLEEMSRFWSGFFQVPYTLSTFYDATAVQIQAPLPTTAALPVAQSRTASPQQPPAPQTPIGTGLGPQLGPFPAAPVEAGASLPIGGENLVAGMLAGVDGTWIEIEANPAGGLAFTLPRMTAPGAHEVRLGVVGTHGLPAPVPGSQPQSLAVRPVPFDPSVEEMDGVQTIFVTVDPPPDPATQALAVDLVGLSSPGTSIRVTGGTADPLEPTILRFVVPGGRGAAPIRPGEYVVMVEVDGIPSLPRMVGGSYREPEVTVS